MPEELPSSPEKQSDQINPEFSIPELDSLGPSKSPKKSNKKIILIAVVAIFLLIIIGGLAYFFSNSQGLFIKSTEKLNQFLDLDAGFQTNVPGEYQDKSKWLSFVDEDFGIEFIYPGSWDITVRKIEHREQYLGGVSGIQDPSIIGKIFEIQLKEVFNESSSFSEGLEMYLWIRKKQDKNIADGYLEYNKQRLDAQLERYLDSAEAEVEDLGWSLQFQARFINVDNKKALLRGNFNVEILNGNTLYDIRAQLNAKEIAGITTLAQREDKKLLRAKDHETFGNFLEDFVSTFKILGDGKIEGGADIFVEPEEEVNINDGEDNIEEVEQKEDNEVFENIQFFITRLELYHNKLESFPLPPVGLNRLGIDATILTNKGFDVGQIDTEGLIRYMDPIYLHPSSPKYDYLYYLCDADTYIIEFYLTEPYKTLETGLYFAKSDRYELSGYEIPENCLDLDFDGLPNFLEDQYGTEKNNSDTDGDGFLDGAEVRDGFNPNGPGSL